MLEPSVIVRQPHCLVAGAIFRCRCLRGRDPLFFYDFKDAMKSLLLDHGGGHSKETTESLTDL